MSKKVLVSLMVLGLVVGLGVLGSGICRAVEGAKGQKAEVKDTNERLKPKIQKQIKFAGVPAQKIKVKEVKQLTFDGGYNEELEWSPDGTKLLTGDRHSTLTIISVDGSSRVDLGTKGLDYKWSPDGAKIAYSAFEKGIGNYIWVMNADGSNKKKLVRGLWFTWSPDGNKIAFRTPTDLSIVNIDGSNQIELVSGEIRSPIVWLPSDKIAYLKKEGDPHPRNLYTINSDGTNEKKIAEDVGFTLWWLAKDGGKSKVYYPPKLDLMNEDGSNKIKVPGDVGPEDWSPDGTKFVGTIGEMDRMGDRQISGEVCIINQDGTGKNQLTNTPDLIEWMPKWSPIGDKIAYTDLDNGNIYVMTLE